MGHPAVGRLDDCLVRRPVHRFIRRLVRRLEQQFFAAWEAISLGGATGWGCPQLVNSQPEIVLGLRSVHMRTSQIDLLLHLHLLPLCKIDRIVVGSQTPPRSQSNVAEGRRNAPRGS